MSNEVSFKVYLQRHKEPSFHRFRGAYTFAEFQSVVGHLWGTAPKALLFEYQDDEGDRVRLTTDTEWSECLRLWNESNREITIKTMPLRVFVRRLKKDKDEKKEDKKAKRHSDPNEAVNEGASDVEEEEQPQPASVPKLPTLALPTRESVCDAPAAVAEEITSQQEEAPKKPSVTFECPEHGAVIDLLSALFGCNAAEKLLSGNDAQFQPVVRRSVNPFDPTEVHLDIDRQTLYHRAVQQANQALDDKRYDFAETLLRTALAIYTDNMLLEYNLACALSLQNKLDEAIGMLSLAIEHGYDNVEHLKRDVDLNNLRSHPAFPMLHPGLAVPATMRTPRVSEHPASVTKVAPQPEPVAPPAVEAQPVPQPVSEPKREAPVQPEPQPLSQPQSTSIPPAVKTLMTVFPGMTVEEARAALQRSRGNVAVAVNNLLMA